MGTQHRSAPCAEGPVSLRPSRQAPVARQDGPHSSRHHGGVGSLTCRQAGRRAGAGYDPDLSPAQHQPHHSAHPEHFDANYGAWLAVWDRMAGTLLRAPEPPERYGVSPENATTEMTSSRSGSARSPPLFPGAIPQPSRCSCWRRSRSAPRTLRLRWRQQEQPRPRPLHWNGSGSTRAGRIVESPLRVRSDRRAHGPGCVVGS